MHHLLVKCLDFDCRSPQVHLSARSLDLYRPRLVYKPFLLVFDRLKLVQILHDHVVVLGEGTPLRVQQYSPVGQDGVILLVPVMDSKCAVEPDLLRRHEEIFEGQTHQLDDEKKLQTRTAKIITEDPKSPAMIPSAVSAPNPRLSMYCNIGALTIHAKKPSM